MNNDRMQWCADVKIIFQNRTLNPYKMLKPRHLTSSEKQKKIAHLEFSGTHLKKKLGIGSCLSLFCIPSSFNKSLYISGNWVAGRSV